MYNKFGFHYLLLLVLILLALFLIKKSQNQKREILKLILEKTDLQVASKEYLRILNKKDLLLKEIHHRVKNNLQLIVSLLSINIDSHHQISIEDVLKIVQSRIIAMAIIHHKLCEEEKFTKLDMQEYLEKLIENIKESYQVENIEFIIYSKNISFDLDTAIPLGLMINELVCNTIKYAFENTEKGIFKIIIKQRSDIDYTLYVGDNGNGNCLTNKQTTAIGMELVYLLVKQINGNIQKLKTKGTNYIINFQEVN